MAVNLRKWVKGGSVGFEVDIHTMAPDGSPIRERVKAPVTTREAARRWAARREMHLALEHGIGGCRCRATQAEGEVDDDKRFWTAERYLRAWVGQRQVEKVPGADQELQRVVDYVVPVVGNIRLVDLRPRHARLLVKALRQHPSRRGGTLAPRTIRSTFYMVRQAIQDAVLDELLPSNPVAVRRTELPGVEDKDPTWRHMAVFDAREVELLVSSPKVAEHRRVAYAIEFLTGLRTGQVSALRWGDCQAKVEPLGCLVSAFSWDSHRKERKPTKTRAVFQVPVHPTLARILAAWRLTGWARRMGRRPTDEDLIVPTVRGTHRDVRKALEDFHEDLERLGLRRRRHYDARRTFVSLGLGGGAPKDVLKAITHPRPTDAFDLYRSMAWLALCEAVRKLQVEVREGTVVALPLPAALRPGGAMAETEALPALAAGAEKTKPPEPFGSGGLASGGV